MTLVNFHFKQRCKHFKLETNPKPIFLRTEENYAIIEVAVLLNLASLYIISIPCSNI